MVRRLGILPTLSLALMAAALGAWPFSYANGCGLCASGFGLAGAAVVFDGGLTLGGVGEDVRTGGGGHWLAFAEPPFAAREGAAVFLDATDSTRGGAGFSLTRSKAGRLPVLAAVRVPLWAVAGAASVPLLARLNRHRRVRRRRRMGRCIGCGYDLRVVAGRCPECGMVNEQAVSAA